MSKYGTMWVDGEFINSADANIAIMTHGLHYASSVFEGIRIYNQKPFMLMEHIARLRKSAALLDMDIKFADSDIEQAIYEITQKNNINFGYIRPIVFRGGEEVKIAAPNSSIHVAIAAWSTADITNPKDLSKGYKLTIGEYRRSPKECLPFESKCAASYAIATVEKHKAIRLGYDDALLLDVDGNIAETTSSNVFFVKDNQLFTPVPDCFLNGLTRQKVLEIAKNNHITVHETKIALSEIANFSDAFVTSTTLDIMPVNAINQVSYTRHDITKKIYDIFYSQFISYTLCHASLS